METTTVYIITDSNRAYLEVRICDSLSLHLQEIQPASPRLFSSSPKLNNIVYMETFEQQESALSYYRMLSNFTRMQREKLIRLKNPNWLKLNISPTSRKNTPQKRRIQSCGLPAWHKV